MLSFTTPEVSFATTSLSTFSENPAQHQKQAAAKRHHQRDLR